MRFSRRIEIGWVDLAPLFALVPALHDEWRALTFDGAGDLRNPITTLVEPSLALSSGRHAQVGAVYLAKVESPIMTIPTEHRERLDAEREALAERDAGPVEVAAHAAERRRLSEQTGVDTLIANLQLRADDRFRLAFGLRDPDQFWSAEVEADRQDAPTASGSWQADLSAMLREELKFGCLLWLLAGKAEAEGRIATPSLTRRGGRLISAKARVNRFRFELVVDVDKRRDTWRFDVDLRIKARGLGRLVLLFGRSRIATEVNGVLDDFSTGDGSDLLAEIRMFIERIESAGSPAAFVHRALWEDGYLDNASGP